MAKCRVTTISPYLKDSFDAERVELAEKNPDAPGSASDQNSFAQ